MSESQGHFLRTCEILGFRPEDFIGDIFKEGMDHAIIFHDSDTLLAEFCLKKYSQCVTVKKEHLKYAFREDDINLAILLIKAGGNPYEIKNWQEYCSEQMIKKIKKC